MISSAIAILLAVAAAEDPVEVRRAYSRCLKEFVQTSLDKKVELVAFDSAFASACQDKEVRLKAMLIQSGITKGMKRNISEKATAEEIADYRIMAKEEFQSQLETTPKP